MSDIDEGDVETVAEFEARTRQAVKPATKDSNPKDAAAFDRAPMHLVPLPAFIQWTLAHAEGGSKYGWWNWTIVGVRSSVYVAAAARHLFKWFFGQDEDPKTGVHHLGYCMACCAILIDAQWRKKLNDDRPPALPRLDALFEQAERQMATLVKLFGDRTPRHYTIADSEESPQESSGQLPDRCSVYDDGVCKLRFDSPDGYVCVGCGRHLRVGAR